MRFLRTVTILALLSAFAAPALAGPSGEVTSLEGLQPVSGEVCDRVGEEACVSTLILTALHTEALSDTLWARPSKAGTTLNTKFANRSAEPAGRIGGYFYIWLKSDAKADFQVPWNRMHCVDYHGPGDNDYKLRRPTFLANKSSGFPTIDDPRVRERGAPDYVIWCESTGGYATGLIHPKSMSKSIAQGFWCPEDNAITSFPNRRTKNEGMLIDYPKFNRSMESYLYGALVVR